MIYLALFLLFFFVGCCVAHDRYNRPTILKPETERPFTSEELRQLGIIVPDQTRYDCETFVTGKAYREWIDPACRRASGR